MTIELLSRFFMWSSVINLACALLVVIVIRIGGSNIYKIHSNFFNVSEEKAAQTIYASMVSYKTIIFVFNVIPYIVLQIIK